VTPRRAAAALAAAFLAPASLSAQGWTVDAAAGRAVHDPVSARIGSTVASLGLSYDGASRWLYLSAGGPLGDPGPAWGAAGAGAWMGAERFGLTLGASLGAHAFGYGETAGQPAGGGLTVEVLPGASWERGPVRAELSSGVVGTADLSGDSAESRVASDSYARLAYAVAEGVAVAADGRFVAADGEGWPYAGGSLEAARGRVSGWAYGGRWLGEDFVAPRTAYGVGAGYGIDRRTRVEASYRQETVDPVYATSTPRRSWTVQVSRRLGSLREAPPSAPAAAPRVSGGYAVFRVPVAGQAAAPELVGDFTGWRPVAMTAEDGFWTARVALGPGVWHYGYRTAGGAFFLPPGVPTVDDGMGGSSAVLVVP
jgi:hypothetical protein